MIPSSRCFVSPQVRQALIDMEAMFELKELQPKVTDRPNAQPLHLPKHGYAPDLPLHSHSASTQAACIPASSTFINLHFPEK
jgi:hypothetical protein